MHKEPVMPPAGEAILAGDLETMRRLAGDGSLLFRKGKMVRLFAYTDVAEIICDRRKVLSFVEDSEDYCVMLVWEPKSRKIWFADMEHDVFHPMASWTKFIKHAGRYINRAVVWDFDD